MAIAAAMLGAPLDRVRIRHLQQMDLLRANLQPGPWKTQCRAVFRHGYAQQIAVKHQ